MSEGQKRVCKLHKIVPVFLKLFLGDIVENSTFEEKLSTKKALQTPKTRVMRKVIHIIHKKK